MSVQFSCDMCGSPNVVPNGFASLQIQNAGESRVFRCNAEFTIATDGGPKISDKRGDVCNKCLAQYLRKIADNLES